jgi:molybdopterin molybdotransferase
VTKAFPRGANIIQKGEDLTAGEPLVAAGQRLRPQDLAVLATFGIASVPVFRRPRVAIISTGNELCPPHETPRLGQVRDINQAVLAAEVRATGADVTLGGIVPDDSRVLEDKLRDLLQEHDVVMLSGGSSVGVKDLAGEVVAKLGSPGIVFHGIHIRPGKPTLFAVLDRKVDRKIVFGLPGFPTSSMIVFEAFVRPMLSRLGGETVAEAWPAPIEAVLSEDVASVVGREDYVRVRLTPRGETLEAEPLRGGSAALRNVLLAEGLLRVPAPLAVLPRGTRVRIRPF